MSIPTGEISAEFIQGMRNRMEVSYCKYGPIKNAYPHKVSAIASLEQRLKRYIETGNTEWLMDVANFAMIEFMLPSHPQAHFRSTESHESPGRESHAEGTTSKSNSELEEGLP